MVVAADTASALSASGTVRYGNACSTCGEEEDEDRDCYCFISHRPSADADDIGSSRDDNCFIVATNAFSTQDAVLVDKRRGLALVCV